MALRYFDKFNSMNFDTKISCSYIDKNKTKIIINIGGNMEVHYTKFFTQAILNYERAKKLNPRDEDIKHNLTIANAYVVDKIDIIPEFFLKNWITNIVNMTSSDNWAIISISSFILFLLLFLIYLFSGRIGIKKLSFWLGILIFFISILSFYSSLRRKQLLTLRNSAIIITPTVTAKSSPAETGVDLFVIHEGARIKIVDSIDVWNEIKLSDGKRGWIRKTDLTEI